MDTNTRSGLIDAKRSVLFSGQIVHSLLPLHALPDLFTSRDVFLSHQSTLPVAACSRSASEQTELIHPPPQQQNTPPKNKMVAYGMHLRRPPPPTSSLPPTGLKIWSDALGELSDAAKKAAAGGDAVPWHQKQRRVRIGKDGEPVYSVGSFIAGGAGAWAVVLILFLFWWRPSIYLTGGATGAAFFTGVLLSFLYYSNLRKKDQYQQVVSLFC